MEKELCLNGKQVFLLGIKDMLSKGAVYIESLPNRFSRCLVEQIISEYELTKEEFMGEIVLSSLENINRIESCVLKR